MNRVVIKGLMATAIIGFFATSCQKDDEGPEETKDPNAQLKSAIVANYADIVYASYEDSYNKAVELRDAINDFVANPTASGMDNAKQAWLDAREPYGQTEVYRFYSGPIDDDNGPEGDLNAWPLDEAHIDYVEDGTGNEENPGSEANIVNNTEDYPVIDAVTLRGLNENGSEKNISIGYHAIEFLLWGQDFNANGPGNRPYTDYVTDGSGTHTHQERRGQYLKVTAELLVEDLQYLVDAWNASGNNFRSTFVGQSSNQSLAEMLTGMGVLSKSELAGERIYVALDNQDQEDEHSCFSDNTHRDIILNAEGIQNVFEGTYTRTDGTVISGSSIRDLLAAVDQTMATELQNMITTSVLNAQAIPTPFDQAITQESVSGNGPIMQTVRSLQDQGDKIAEAAEKLGLSINLEG